jgi:hypothetical protein
VEIDYPLTFPSTSPSIYITFQSVYATNYCGSVGEDIDATTLAFSPDALSTARAYSWYTDDYDRQPTLSAGQAVFTQATWEDE